MIIGIRVLVITAICLTLQYKMAIPTSVNGIVMLNGNEVISPEIDFRSQARVEIVL